MTRREGCRRIGSRWFDYLVDADGSVTLKQVPDRRPVALIPPPQTEIGWCPWITAAAANA